MAPSPPLLPQHARVATLEKQNRDLAWQVAMLTRGGGGTGAGGGRAGAPSGSVAVTVPPGELPGRGSLLGLLGWALRYRKQLTMGYLVVLHALVYLALTHGALFGAAAGSTDCAVPAAAAATVAGGGGAAGGGVLVSAASAAALEAGGGQGAAR